MRAPYPHSGQHRDFMSNPYVDTPYAPTAGNPSEHIPPPADTTVSGPGLSGRRNHGLSLCVVPGCTRASAPGVGGRLVMCAEGAVDEHPHPPHLPRAFCTGGLDPRDPLLRSERKQGVSRGGTRAPRAASCVSSLDALPLEHARRIAQGVRERPNLRPKDLLGPATRVKEYPRGGRCRSVHSFSWY